MSFPIKYRPKTLDQIKGNEETVSALRGLLKDKENFPHTLLFYGYTGCGKTTLGRIVSTELGCKGYDFREINSADFRGIETIREIIKQSQYLALEGTIRVWLIDEVHKLTNDAQNALLKILEEPPDHVYFILCTTDPQKLLPTIKSRCSQFQVRPVSREQLRSLLEKVVHREKADLEEEIYEQIIDTSICAPRHALQILEQVLSVIPKERMEIAKRGIENQTNVIDLCRIMLRRPTWSQVNTILRKLKDDGVEAEDIRRTILGYAQAVLLKTENDRAALIIEEFRESTYDIGFPGVVYACYAITKNKLK